MSTTNTTFKSAPKSDDPVVVEADKCFISKDGRHIYRQHEHFVLHLNLDLHMDDDNHDKHFLINTLYDNHLTEYIREEWLNELDPILFQRTYDNVKSLMP